MESKEAPLKLRSSHPGLFNAFFMRSAYFLTFGLHIFFYDSATKYAGYEVLKNIASVDVWGLLWFGIGLFMLMSIVFDWRKIQLFTGSFSVFLPMVWAIALLPTTAFLSYMFIGIAGLPLVKEPPLNPVTEKK